MKRYKKRAERRLIRQSKKQAGKIRWDKAVVVLTGALTEAIWNEGGDCEDALATAEIAHCAIVMDLQSMFAAESRGESHNVVPFKRKASYMRGIKQ